MRDEGSTRQSFELKNIRMNLGESSSMNSSSIPENNSEFYRDEMKQAEEFHGDRKSQSIGQKPSYMREPRRNEFIEPESPPQSSVS